MSLSEYDRVRYRRQLMIPGFGEKAQLRLKKATALIAGLGGLARLSPCISRLRESGTLSLLIWTTSSSAILNRQVLHWDEDVGESKVNSAMQKLQRSNPTIHVEGINLTIDDKNVLELAEDCDVILDAMDNFSVRYLLNAAAIAYRVPLIHGAVYGYEGA